MEAVPIAEELGLECPYCGGQLEDAIGPFWCPACGRPVSAWLFVMAALEAARSRAEPN
jgi:hypothetical protein